MNMELIKNENDSERVSVKDVSEARFNLFKNMIVKDLEVVSWSNKAIKVFGEFQIYSNSRTELNSFDQIIEYITGREVVFGDDSIEGGIAFKCQEHFLTMLILEERKLSFRDLNALAVKYTNYLLEATELLIENKMGASAFLKELDVKYFGDKGRGLSHLS
ncbi:MAG: hypothetical protein K2Q18_16020 [Bdellovibrionales bacterium]|nr:hypothetical protein [Bdellovibrionales bacterium]